jgi:superfamily II DNA or RNA helicase
MANDNIRNILIIRKLKELVDAGKKILYFSTTKNQSLIISTVLQQLGIKAVHVSGDTDRSFRRQINKKFKETTEINVICNYDIFSTGFDVPKLDVVFIARPVNSPVLFNQIVGRGTRGPKMDGTATHTLVQVIDKKPSRFIGFDPYKQYGFWDDKWKSANE